MSQGWLYIDGSRHMGGGAEFVSLDPATGDAVWEGNAASASDIKLAINAARKAFPTWSLAPQAEREAVVRAFGEQLKQHGEALARSIAIETGKPLWDARTEVASMSAKIDISIQARAERTGERDTQNGALRTQLRHRPHGVVAVFGPYNFPGHLPNGHIVPALLAGNCVLFKPSELAPGVAEETLKLWEAAGIPAGVLQLLQGEAETGELLSQQPDLDGLFFTGSRRTGLLLNRQFAAHPEKILALELGGNNPLVVGELSNHKAALLDIIQSAFLSTGQRCSCARRLLVPHGKQGDALIDALIAALQSLSVGAWDDEPEPYMGPVISVRAATQLLGAQTQLIALGAKPLLAMTRLRRGGAFLSPGVLDVSGIAHLPDEEYFGPLLQVIRYEHFEQALQLANRTRYGLSAALLSESPQQWAQFQTQIRAGVVNWNRQTTGAASALPFGGVGFSGNHRPSAYYAADYCAYPVATMAQDQPVLPAVLPPGLLLS